MVQAEQAVQEAVAWQRQGRAEALMPAPGASAALLLWEAGLPLRQTSAVGRALLLLLLQLLLRLCLQSGALPVAHCWLRLRLQQLLLQTEAPLLR